jgi:hypothetical protein
MFYAGGDIGTDDNGDTGSVGNGFWLITLCLLLFPDWGLEFGPDAKSLSEILEIFKADKFNWCLC